MVLWGGNAIVAKASAGLIGAVPITFYRWLLASVLLMPFVIGTVVGRKSELLRHLPRLILLGFLGCALFPCLMYLAARDTSAVNIGIIQALTPLLALGIAQAWSRTAIMTATALGLVISLLGVCLVVSHGDPAALLSRAPNQGDLLMLVAALCFALYSVLLERWRSNLPTSVELFVQSAAATALLIPLFALTPWQPVAPAAWSLIAYAGVLGSVVAPLLWISGVAQIGPARAITYFSLLPLVTAALAVALLDEPLEAALVLGGLLVVGGVILAERAAMQ